MSTKDFSWAISMMRAGYAGRGLTYVVVAGVSLWAIWQGGSAEGTGSALGAMQGNAAGQLALIAIGVGLLAYAAWRIICAAYDLEDYGTDGEGLVARAGQVTTGAIHGILGAATLIILFTASSGGDGSTVSDIAGWIMGLPGGKWIVLVAGLLTIGAGGYYALKGWQEKYRQDLIGNDFTVKWNELLKAGVLAQALIITIIGVFLSYAGWTANPEEAGGLGGVWEFLRNQPFGQFMVVAVCVGLLCFALFCFVNAAYRRVPKADDDNHLTTLAARLKERAS